jgi:hypothetical protein
MHPNAEQIIEEMIAYNKNFVEKAHPSFGSLPVCPFAKKARIEERLKYVVGSFCLSRMFEAIDKWRKDDHSQAIIFVDPDKNMCVETLNEFVRDFSINLPFEFNFFVAHPNDETKFHGVETRREPYPNIQVMKVEVLKKSQEQLRHSPRWYLESQAQSSG